MNAHIGESLKVMLIHDWLNPQVSALNWRRFDGCGILPPCQGLMLLLLLPGAVRPGAARSLPPFIICRPFGAWADGSWAVGLVGVV